MTNLETLKAKAEKKKAEAKDLEKQIKEAELAEKETEKLMSKLDTLSVDISKSVRQILDNVEITLPAGKQILTIADSNGELSTSIVNSKTVKARSGNGGAKAITFEGEQISWAKLCEIKNVARTPSGSAHRDCYQKDRQLHDSIQHECSIDHKQYPVS